MRKGKAGVPGVVLGDPCLNANDQRRGDGNFASLCNDFQMRGQPPREDMPREKEGGENKKKGGPLKNNDSLDLSDLVTDIFCWDG